MGQDSKVVPTLQARFCLAEKVVAICNVNHYQVRVEGYWFQDPG